MGVSRRSVLAIAGAFGFGSGSAAASDGENEDHTVGFGDAFGASFGGTPDPQCFIATASTSPTSPEVKRLRAFRDDVLEQHRIGRAAIRLYYATSPPVARWVARREWRRTLVRTAIVRPAVRLTNPIRPS